MLLNLAPLLVLLPTVLADSASILSSLTSISTASSTLNSTISTWNGTFFSLLPVLRATADLSISIHNSTLVAQNTTAASLTAAQSAQLVAAVGTMGVQFDLSLTSVLAAQSEFADLKLGPMVLVSLVGQKYEFANLTTALEAVVPTAWQAGVAGAFGTLDLALDAAIVDYAKAL